MQVSRLFILIGLATSSATVAESWKGVLWDLEHVRGARPAGHSCTEPRKLAHELEVISGDDQQTLVTIHRSKGCWTDLLTIWQRVGSDFRVWRSFDEGGASADLFHHEGKRFLYLKQWQQAAGRSWEGHMLHWVTDTGELQVVEFDGANSCGAQLTHLGSDFDHGYGGSYSFGDEALRFEWNIWHSDDGPNFPSGGKAKGTLSLQETDIPESSLRLVVDSCLVTPLNAG